MNFFSIDKFSGQKTHEVSRCIECDAEPRLVHNILEPRTGRTIRMFECKCGAHTWSE